MTKMQVMFSFQKYASKKDPDDLYLQKDQFALELQQLYVQASNAVNATIDDASYFTAERSTGETWINGAQLFTKTIDVGTLPNAGSTTTAHGITGEVTIVSLQGIAQQTGFPASGDAIPLPFPDVTGAANVELSMDKTNIILDTGGNYSAYKGFVTVKYTKK